MSTIVYSWQYERNAAMKVFSRLYVGTKSQTKGVDLGFATPYEENAAGRKRQETVNTWAGGYGSWENGKHVPGTPTTRIIENEPAAGFKITDDVKRVYWGGGNVVWRVEDPRGFELEIQSANLMAILQTAGVESGGLIPGKCVWGRSGGDNILLHESSEEYRDSVKAAETLKAPKQVAKTQRQVGGIYRMVDGSTAVYLGKVHVCRVQYPDGDNQGNVEHAFDTAKTSRILLNWERYDLQPSEPFEAVLPVYESRDGKPSPSTTILLYKKAPLVDNIGVYDCEVTNGFLDSYNWKFASSSISCARITSVTVDPILNPVVKLLPWTEKQYADIRANIVQRGKQNLGWASPASMVLGGNENVLVLDDKIYGDVSVAGDWSSHVRSKTRIEFFACEFIIGEGCYTRVVSTNDAARAFSGNEYLYWHRVAPTNPLTIKPHVKTIPYMADPDAVLAWYDTLHEQRALFAIVTREK